MCDIDPQAPNFQDQKESTFRKLHDTMDSLFRKLRQEGVRADVKHDSVFTTEEESLLWKHGVLGTHYPLSLLCAVLFYSSKKFCLRGGEEHCSLTIAHFKRLEDA